MQRDHLRIFAAACLDALLTLGDNREHASRTVARYVAKWPGLRGDKVDGITIINWRDQCKASEKSRRLVFEKIVGELQKQDNPRAEVMRFLKEGPPGLPKT